MEKTLIFQSFNQTQQHGLKFNPLYSDIDISSGHI